MSADVLSRLETVQEETRELTPVSIKVLFCYCIQLMDNKFSQLALKEMYKNQLEEHES